MKTRVPPRYTISTKLFLLLTLMLVVVFLLIAWINTDLYLNLLEKNVYEHAFQLSDVIKSSTWYSMLKNHREDRSDQHAEQQNPPCILQELDLLCLYVHAHQVGVVKSFYPEYWQYQECRQRAEEYC